MIIGEVKEGSARFNSAVRDPHVVASALIHFGCCSTGDAQTTAQVLLQRPQVITACGHSVARGFWRFRRER